MGFACPTEPGGCGRGWWCVGHSNLVTAPPTLPLEMPPFFSFMSSLILGPWVCSKALLSFVQCYPAAVACWNKPRQLHRPTLPRANLPKWRGSSYGNDSENRKCLKRTRLLFVSGQSGCLLLEPKLKRLYIILLLSI